jgi:DNA/RNA-binding domain of Phe-tRNA-synthetase-like protein
MKFIVSDDFFEKVDNACFGVVIIKGFDNTKSNDKIDKMLAESNKKAMEELKDVRVKETDLVIPYREAFTKLGINPNKFMCSIEAMLTRISKGKEIPSINPIVDLGNALSIKYNLPLGMHDIDNFDGDIMLRQCNNEDTFVPFGSTEEEKCDEGEYCYVSGHEVKTRKWTWRQGEKSKLTEKSTNLFVPIDGFNDVNKDEVFKLQDELVEFLKENYDVEIQTGFVDKDNRVFEFN